MRSIILYGLFIVLLCSTSTRLTKASPVDDDYAEEYSYEDSNYEYDDNSQAPRADDYDIDAGGNGADVNQNKTIVENEIEVENTSISAIDHEHRTESIQSAVVAVVAEIEIPQDDPCPCSCDEKYQLIDCSSHSLTEIPKNFPNTTLFINLTNNNIEEIQENAFSNLTDLRQIVLANNNIHNIHQNGFHKLDRLDHLDLSSNNIARIDPDLFLNAQALSQLNLNNNPIAFQANQPFLNHPNLEVLSLVGCNVTELYDESFMNLTELIDLNLSNNTIAGEINVNSFKPIHSLRKLKIPHISRPATYDLCEKLTVIDVISFDNYNISCYELVSGSSYEESTIKNGPPTEAHMETTVGSVQSPRIETTSTTEETVILTENYKHNVTETTDYSLTTSDVAGISNIDALNTTNEVEQKKLEKSSQSIKTILIASIVVAVIGLVIGLICRKDVFGVKTKLCRTQRPEPATVPEQVPLNKV